MKIKRFALLALLVSAVLTATACSFDIDWSDYRLSRSFVEREGQVDETGYTYYVDAYDGLCILRLPEDETLEIPAEIAGIPVSRFGCYVNEPFNIHTEEAYSATVKHLILRTCVYGDAVFPALETVTAIDPLGETMLCPIFETDGERYVDFYFLCRLCRDTCDIELRHGENAPVADYYAGCVIKLPEIIKVIDKEVFAGLENVTFRTPYLEDEIPDGWEEGWNNGWPVEYGASMN